MTKKSTTHSFIETLHEVDIARALDKRHIEALQQKAEETGDAALLEAVARKCDYLTSFYDGLAEDARTTTTMELDNIETVAEEILASSNKGVNSFDELVDKYPFDRRNEKIPEIIKDAMYLKMAIDQTRSALSRTPHDAAISAIVLMAEFHKFSPEAFEKAKSSFGRTGAAARWSAQEGLIQRVSGLTKDWAYRHKGGNDKHNNFLDWLCTEYKDENGGNPFSDSSVIGKDTLRKTIIGALEECHRTDLIRGYNK